MSDEDRDLVLFDGPRRIARGSDAAVAAALRKALGRRFKKRPNVEIHVIRV